MASDDRWREAEGAVGSLVAVIGERDSLRAQVADLTKAVRAIPVNHRHDCPKVKPKPDTVCSLGVLHLGREDSRCDCFAEQTQAAIDAILASIRV